MEQNKERRLSNGSGKKQRLLDCLILKQKEMHISKEITVGDKMDNIDFD
jgi:hypothetical protein